MKTITPDTKILGMYLPNTKALYPGVTREAKFNIVPGNIDYLPVLELFSLKDNEEITLVDGNNVSNDLPTYNSAASSQNLTSAVIANKRLDVSQNDLLLGPVTIVINLTGHNVTICTDDGLKKMFRSIKSDKLNSHDGKLLILTLYTFNNPRMFRGETEHSNYFEILHAQQKIVYERTNKHKDLLDIYAYLLTQGEILKSKVYSDEGNCVKVATMDVLEKKHLLESTNKYAYIQARRMLVGLTTPGNVIEHPLSSTILNIVDLQKKLIKNSVVCYIVDNEDKIKDRYINYAGTVLKVDKIKEPSIPDALYVIRTDSEGHSSESKACGLDELDANKYVYTSREEANSGADVQRSYTDDLAKTRADQEAYKLKQAKDLLELEAHYDKLMRELKLDHETKRMEQEARSLREKAAYERSSIYDKRNYERDSYRAKDYYETAKFERDSTLETIKTVSAIAGVAATGYLIFSKLNK
jgi:hypothetical protein